MDAQQGNPKPALLEAAVVRTRTFWFSPAWAAVCLPVAAPACRMPRNSIGKSCATDSRAAQPTEAHRPARASTLPDTSGALCLEFWASLQSKPPATTAAAVSAPAVKATAANESTLADTKAALPAIARRLAELPFNAAVSRILSQRSHLFNRRTDVFKEEFAAAEQLGKTAWVQQPGVLKGLDFATERLLFGDLARHIITPDADGSRAWGKGDLNVVGGLLYEYEAELLAMQGEVFKAFPLLCRVAFLTALQWGPESPPTLSALWHVIDSQQRRGVFEAAFYEWLLPRCAQHFGIDHADTRELVQRAAEHLYQSSDPREHTQLTQIVTDIAQQLPGGLGWGSTVVAPVPDEEAFNRYAVMASKADTLMEQGHYKLANEMLTRCVAYYESLGPHWLGTPRRLRCMLDLALCAERIEGPEAFLPLLRDVKRAAQRELGATHSLTLDLGMLYGASLVAAGRAEAAVSVLQRAAQQLQDTFGGKNSKVIACKSTLAGAFHKVGKSNEARAMLMDVFFFEEALMVEGPSGSTTTIALGSYLNFHAQNSAERKALRARAKLLGCDIVGAKSVGKWRVKDT